MRNLLHVPAILLHREMISDKMSFCTATMQYSNNVIPLIKNVNHTLNMCVCVRVHGALFVSKFFLKDYGSGTNQMGGFVGGAPFLQVADFWTWILYLSFRS